MPNLISFKNPPITEALLDIRVTLPKETTVESLETYQKDIKEEFPNRKVKWEGSFQIRVGELSPAPEIKESSGKKIGYMFSTSNGQKIVQTRLDGFTFNWLKPYPGWEKFSKEAKKHFENYLKLAKPVSINRIALRYINTIEIPQPIEDFKQYFLTSAEVGPGIPQALSEYFFRLAIVEPDTKNTAIIIQTIDLTKVNDKTIPFIFDIDVFRKVDLKPTDDQLWEIFKSLRTYKNNIFVKSLTDKTKDLFK